ncbi:MAG: phenylacetaldehyde dehydrogenase [Verrucomicrobia bacterium RIFCSPHIGHO2_12_FULL_41_10]|nr:MAG: phenylacetaldehyde dehydrogenase [Verrucomicrobia bacterium RIFCSPHIGHO2_12_FULL_41_10]
MKTFPLFINGVWRMGSEKEVAEDFNPMTGELYARVAQASASDVEDAIASAHRARKDWQKMLASEREAILLKAADVIIARTDEICDVLIDETGSIRSKAMFEISYCVNLLRTAAAMVLQVCGEMLPMTMPGQIGMTIRQPLGVIAGISPFNAPFILALKKVAFALATGNTFVLKPSQLTPVIGLKIAEIFEEAGLPPGVLNVIPGPAEAIGNTLMADPRVKMITFTGSVGVGLNLGAQAGHYMKRLTLELGGKNPFIILQDANIDYAVNAATFGIFFHQGQVCMASSRIIIEAPLFDIFCEKFVAKAKTLKVGDPRDPATVIGPLIEASHCEIIDQHVQDAVSKGARLLYGGTHVGPLYQPTILAGVTREMEIFNKESFGPITSLICVANSEEALAVANDSSYGLSSSLITNDLQKAFDLSLRLEAGMVHINDCTVLDEPNASFGGIKNSGFGREGGHSSIEEMTELKWITLQLGQRTFPF